MKKSEESAEETRTKIVNYSRKLSKLEADNKESLKAVTDRVGKLETDKSERVKKLGSRITQHRERIKDLKGEQRRQKKVVAGLEA